MGIHPDDKRVLLCDDSHGDVSSFLQTTSLAASARSEHYGQACNGPRLAATSRAGF